MDKTEALKKYFGYSSFRSGQGETVDAILAGRDVLAVMPTGAGKSVCYQIPAVMKNGVTLVVSPLISLMKDQVYSLDQSGIPSCCINSSLDFRDLLDYFDMIKRGMIKIVYVAPERLDNPAFLDLCQQIHIPLLAVDEAHCVSQWGQDFRPSYLEIIKFIKALPYRPQVCAFTATATSKVKKDICNILELHDPFIISTGFDRKNLSFYVYNPQNKYKALLKLLDKHRDECGIIYCSTRKNVDDVCERLVKAGYSAGSYHAGLDEETRKNSQDDFIYDRVKIMVATNAFGMGIDKSDVSFVIHYNMPKDIESYYQEAGRAGRDGSESSCYLLYSSRDYHLNRFILQKSVEEGYATEEVFEENMRKLRKMETYARTRNCLRHFILDYFGDESPVWCGKCSNCKKNYKEVDVTLPSQKILSCVYRVAQRNKYVGKTTLIKILQGSKSKKIISQKLDSLSTYGIMEEVGTERIKDIIDELIMRSYLGITDTEYPVVYMNKSAARVLKNQERVMVRFPAEAEQAEEESSQTPAYDRELMKRLKALRLRLAEEAGVPAYVIFTNSSLEDMCIKQPVTMEEFRKIKSVGALRAEKYGYDFTEEIKKYRSQGR